MNIELPEYLSQDRERITHNICRVIRETFIDTADEDYVVARTLAFSRNYRAFYWPALQCLEKYLKASLLFLDLPVKKYGHDIGEMTAVLGERVATLSALELKPLPMHMELAERIDWGSTRVSDFMAHIELNGMPSNRYNYFGVSSEYSALLKLDQVVHAIRTKLVGNSAFYRLTEDHPLVEFAYDQNPLNAPSVWVHKPIWGRFGEAITVPVMEAVLKGFYGNAGVYEAWLRKNLVIKDHEIDRLKADPISRDDQADRHDQ